MNPDELVAIARALGDPTRFAVLCRVGEAGEASCGDLARSADISQPTASHHLKALGEVGLVEVRHVAQRSFFRVDGGRLIDFTRSLAHLLGPVDGLPDLGDGVID
jgi:DNA-binding transcriptional ArsR family regulator